MTITRCPAGRAFPIVLLVICATALPRASAQVVGAQLTEKRVKFLGMGVPVGGNRRQYRLELSRTGDHYAAMRLEKDRRVSVSYDGRSGKTIGWYFKDSLVISPDGKRYAYNGSEKGRNRVVVNDKVIEGAMCPAFSPVKGRLAYFTRRKGKPVLVVEGRRVMRAGYGGSEVHPIVFSADGKHVAFRRRHPRKGQVVFLDGKVVRNSTGSGRPVFSPNGKRLAFVAGLRRQVHVRCGRKTEGPYEEVKDVVFSADGKRLAYGARIGGKWHVVCDGKKSEAFIAVGAPVFSPDSRRLAYSAQDAAEGPTPCLLVLDGKRTLKGLQVSRPVFSPDSKHVLCHIIDREGRVLLVCDGRKGTMAPINNGFFTWIGFSPDSRHVAAVCRSMPPGQFLVIDGISGPAHTHVQVPERYDHIPGKLRYVVVDIAAVSLVEVDWPKGHTWEDVFNLTAR